MPLQSIVAEIKARVSLLDLVTPRVALKKSGRAWRGLCPFHPEKTPSFYVFPDQGTFHCFGCGANGDHFTFLMRTENLDFAEALRRLAEQAGVTLPSRAAEAAEERRKAHLRAVLLAAAEYYHHLLRQPLGERARAYLAQRGVEMSTAEQFLLGWAPEGWDTLLRHLVGRGFPVEDLVTVGLVVAREGGGHYDRFRGRLMFPIRDLDGHVTGFGARVLDEGQPKYLNSPQTPLFDKSASLYGIDQAREAIRRTGEAILVEGYMDVLIAHQGGIKNVVATLGTALTERQVRLLKRLTRRVVLALDPDAAGDAATMRGLEAARQGFDYTLVPVPTARGLIRYERRLDADIRIAQLPRGRDPDEIIRTDPEAFRQCIAAAQPFIDYYLSAVLQETDLSAPRAKSAAVQRLLPVIAELGDPIVQAHYLHVVAQRLHLPASVVEEAFRQQRPARAPSVAAAPAIVDSDPVRQVEEHLLGLALRYTELPEVVELVLALSPEDLCSSPAQAALVWLQAQLRQRQPVGPAAFAAAPAPVGEYLEALWHRAQTEPPIAPHRLRAAFALARRRLRRERLHHEVAMLHRLLQDAEQHGETDLVQEYLRRIRALNAELAALDAARHVGDEAQPMPGGC